MIPRIKKQRKKLFYFDTETSGLVPGTHDILSLAFILCVEGKNVLERQYFLRPWSLDNLDPKALEVNGFTPAQVQGFPSPKEVHTRLLMDLALFCDKFDPKDKFYPCAYNGTTFDDSFLRHHFTKCEDKYYGSWFNHRILDPLPLLRYLDYYDILTLPNLKLATVAKGLGYPDFAAHDALADVKALQFINETLEGFLHGSPIHNYSEEEDAVRTVSFTESECDSLQRVLDKLDC